MERETRRVGVKPTIFRVNSPSLGIHAGESGLDGVKPAGSVN
jgi:hypothetical protein